MQKVYLVTGGNTGLGFAFAKQLVQQENIHLILTCRNEEKCVTTQKALEPYLINTCVLEVLALDLADFGKVKDFAQNLRTRPNFYLNALVNNAGVYMTRFEDGEDGVEQSLQVNVYSPMLLFLCLKDVFQPSSGLPVVINISSGLSFRVLAELPPLKTANDCIQAKLEPSEIYQTSKKLLNYLTLEAAKQYPTIKFRLVGPGFIPTTELGRNAGNFFTRIAFAYVLPWMPFAKTIDYGVNQYFMALNDEGNEENAAFLSKGEWIMLEPSEHSYNAWSKCLEVLKPFVSN